MKIFEGWLYPLPMRLIHKTFTRRRIAYDGKCDHNISLDEKCAKCDSYYYQLTWQFRAVKYSFKNANSEINGDEIPKYISELIRVASLMIELSEDVGKPIPKITEEELRFLRNISDKLEEDMEEYT